MTFYYPKEDNKQPSRRAGHSSTVLPLLNQFVLFGGEDEIEQLNDLHLFSLQTLTWKKIKGEGEVLPPPRAFHSAVLYNEKTVVIFGGQQNGKSLNDVYFLNTGDNSIAWFKPQIKNEIASLIPNPRHGHTAVVNEHQMIVFGGRKDREEYYNDLFSFDLASFTWAKLVPKGTGPEPRAFHSMTLYSNNLYVFGGHSATSTFNDIFTFNLDTATWSKLWTHGALPSPRFSHASLLLDETHLLIFGGCTHSTQFNDSYILNLSSRSWSSPDLQPADPKKPELRKVCKHSAISHNYKVFIFGGLCSSSQGTSANYSNELIVFFEIESHVNVIGGSGGSPIAPVPSKGRKTEARLPQHSIELTAEEAARLSGGSDKKMTKKISLLRLTTSSPTTINTTPKKEESKKSLMEKFGIGKEKRELKEVKAKLEQVIRERDRIQGDLDETKKNLDETTKTETRLKRELEHQLNETKKQVESERSEKSTNEQRFKQSLVSLTTQLDEESIEKQRLLDIKKRYEYQIKQLKQHLTKNKADSAHASKPKEGDEDPEAQSDDENDMLEQFKHQNFEELNNVVEEEIAAREKAERELSRLETELQVSKNLESELRHRLDESQYNRSVVESVKNRIQTELEAETEKKKAAEIEIIGLKAEINELKELEDVIQKLRAEIARLKNELSTERSAKEDLEKIRKKQEADLNEMRKRSQQDADQLSKLREELAWWMSRVDQLSQDLETASNTETIIVQSNASKDKSGKKDGNEAVVSLVHEKISTLKYQLKDTKSQLESVQGALRQNQTQLADVSEQLEDAQLLNKKLNRQKQQLDSRMDDMIEKHDTELREREADLKKKYTTQIDEINRELNSTTEQRNKYYKEKESLAFQLEALTTKTNDEISLLKQEKQRMEKKLKDEIEYVNLRLEAERSTREKLEKAQMKEKKVVQNLKQQVLENLEQKTQTEQQTWKYQEEVSKTNKFVEEKDNQIKVLTGQKASLELQLASLSETNDQREREITKLTLRLKKSEEETEKILEKQEVMKAEHLKELESMKKRYQLQLDDVNQNLKVALEEKIKLNTEKGDLEKLFEDQLQKSEDEIKKHLTNIRTQKKNFEIELNELKMQLEAEKKARSSQVKQEKVKEKEADTLKKQVHEIESKKTETTQAMWKVNEELNRITQLSQDQRRQIIQLESKQKEFEDIIESRNVDILKHIEMISNIQKQLASAKIELKEFKKSKNEETENIKSSFEKELAQMRNSLDLANDTINNLTAEKQSVTIQLDNLKAYSEDKLSSTERDYQIQIKKLRSEMEYLELRLKAESDSKAKLEKKLKKNKDKNKVLKDQMMQGQALSIQSDTKQTTMRLQEELRTLKENKEELEARVKFADNSIRNLENRIEDLNYELEDVRKAKSKLEEQKESLIEQLEEMTEVYSVVSQKKIQAVSDEFSKEIDKLKNQIKVLTEAKNRGLQEKETLTSQIETLKQQHDDELQQLNNDYKLTKKKLEGEIELLTTRLDSANAKLDKINRAAQKNLKELTMQVHEGQQAKTEKEQTALKLHQELQRVNDLLEQQTEQINKYQEQEKKVQGDNVILRAKVEELQSTNKAWEGKNEQLNEEVKKAKKEGKVQLRQLRSELEEKSEQEIKELKIALEAEKVSRSKIQSDHNTLSEQIQELMAKNMDMEKTVYNSNAKLKKLEGENEYLNLRLQAEIELRQKQQKKSKILGEEANMLQSELKEKSEAGAETRHTAIRLNQQVGHYAAKIEEQQNVIGSLESSHQLLQDRVNALNNQARQAEAKKDEIEKELEGLRGQLKDMKNKNTIKLMDLQDQLELEKKNRTMEIEELKKNAEKLDALRKQAVEEKNNIAKQLEDIKAEHDKEVTFLRNDAKLMQTKFQSEIDYLQKCSSSTLSRKSPNNRTSMAVDITQIQGHHDDEPTTPRGGGGTSPRNNASPRSPLARSQTRVSKAKDKEVSKEKEKEKENAKEEPKLKAKSRAPGAFSTLLTKTATFYQHGPASPESPSHGPSTAALMKEQDKFINDLKISNTSLQSQVENLGRELADAIAVREKLVKEKDDLKAQIEKEKRMLTEHHDEELEDLKKKMGREAVKARRQMEMEFNTKQSALDSQIRILERENLELKARLENEIRMKEEVAHDKHALHTELTEKKNKEKMDQQQLTPRRHSPRSNNSPRLGGVGYSSNPLNSPSKRKSSLRIVDKEKYFSDNS